MRRNGIILFLLIVVGGILVACGGKDEVEENENLQLEDGDVQVTLPPEFFSGLDEEAILAEAEAQEIKHAEIHEDGSVTYTLTEKRHQEIIAMFKDELDFAVKDIAASEDYPSIKRIDAKDEYTKFDIYVDPVAFEEGMDMLATISLYVGSSYYHAFLGKADSIKVTLNYIDEQTDELIESVVLPEDIEEGRE